MALLGGCGGTGPGDRPSGRTSPCGHVPVDDADATGDALRSSGIVLPPGAELLGIEHECGVDELWILAIAVGGEHVDGLLRGSGFREQLEPGRQVFMPPVSGHEPSGTADVASAQDSFRGDDGARIVREVLVDRSDPDRPVVHVWAFTT